MSRRVPIPDAVRWHEGQLLAPHHFQQQALRMEAVLGASLASVLPWAHGVETLSIDEGALLDPEMPRLKVNALRALLPGGQWITTPPLDALDLTLYAQRKRTVRVFLALPTAEAADRSGPLARHYLPERSPVVADLDPEADAGDKGLAVPRLVPNVRLIASDRALGDFEAMPIAELEPTGSSFRLTEYVPSILQVRREGISQRLYARCEELVVKVRDKIDLLRQGLRRASGPAEQARAERQIRSLVTALPEFELMLSSEATHPFTLYTRLCTLAAHCEVLSDLRRMPRFPQYDHRSLWRLFDQVVGGAIQTLDDSVHERFEEIDLDGRGHIYSIQYRPEWAGRGIVIGFIGEDGRAVDRWAEDAYIGTESYRRSMEENRDLGAGRDKQSTIEGLRRRPGIQLYQLMPERQNVHPGGPAPRNVQPGEMLFVYQAVREDQESPLERVILYIEKPAEDDQ